MKILIVCGAGASSTFVAHRVRRSAQARGLAVDVAAGSESELDTALSGLDVVLVGPHLADRFAAIRSRAAAHQVLARLLPDTAFTARDGDAALDLALATDT